jgi:hypothetical protein
LAELLVTEAMQWVVDKITEDFNKKYKAAKQYATNIFVQAAGGALIVASVSQIRQFVQGQDTGTIVAGASLSLHVFGAGFSFIEGPWDIEDPEMNDVYVIGPTLIDQVIPFVNKFKDSWKYKKILNPIANDGKYKSYAQIKKDLLAFKKSLEGLLTGTEDLVDNIKKLQQVPSDIDRPCVFDGDPNCTQLIWEAGFDSVYKYSPPDGFENFTGLPLPIVFLVYNHRNNTMYFATPPFFPTPKPPAQ